MILAKYWLFWLFSACPSGIEYFEISFWKFAVFALPSPRRIEEEDEMDTHWLKSLSNLQCQFKGLQEVEKFFESDYQWIDEVVTEATALFKKNSTQSSSQIDNSDEAEVEDAANVSDDVAPVLLPTTPRVIYKISKIFRNVFYKVFS